MIVSSAEASRTSGSARVLAADTLSTAHIVVTPGDTITSEAGYLRYRLVGALQQHARRTNALLTLLSLSACTRGHGTYVEKGELVASVAGVVERINQLVSVRPMNARLGVAFTHTGCTQPVFQHPLFAPHSGTLARLAMWWLGEYRKLGHADGRLTSMLDKYE